MAEKQGNTERRVLEAAKVVFLRKGMAGARMQEIADEAGINKALLHYYFRSKDKLFEVVFMDSIKEMAPQIRDLFDSDLPLFSIIRLYFDKHISFLQDNPYLPTFLLHELNQNPERLIKTLADVTISPRNNLVQKIKTEVESGKIQNIDPSQLVINMLSLCVFVFVARPLIQAILNLPDENYWEMIEKRKKELPEFVINSISLK